MNDKQKKIELINKHAPKLIGLLGGKLVDFDIEKKMSIFEFNISKDYCHSIDVVQGGFVTAMLDVAMSHSVITSDPGVLGVSSLEINTSYLEATRAGKLRVEGWLIKQSYKTAFMEGRIYNADNLLTAAGSQVAKLVRAKNQETSE